MMSITASGVWRIASLRRLIKEKLPTEFILQEVATYRRTGAAPVLISERQLFHQGRHDLLVIWGGSTGLTARKAATRIGTRVALVEKGPLGGTCVNHG